MLKRLRDPFSGLSHLGAALLALPGLGLLLYLGHDNPAKMITLLMYGLGLTLMFSASAAYHLAKPSPKALLALRKFDHCAIYVMIAGTYTPVCFHYLSGIWRWGMLGTVWGIALAGIAIKLFVIKAPRGITAGIYLLMGWLAMVAIREIVQRMPTAALVWLILGGLFFTLGALIYIFKRPNFHPPAFGFHEVWHIFVILGSLSHYILIAAFIAPAG